MLDLSLQPKMNGRIPLEFVKCTYNLTSIPLVCIPLSSVGPQLNNFDQVSSDDQMSIAWGGYVGEVGRWVCPGGSTINVTYHVIHAMLPIPPPGQAGACENIISLQLPLRAVINAFFPLVKLFNLRGKIYLY